MVLSHARSLSTPVAVAVLHNLHCLGRRSEQRYKGEGFSSQNSRGTLVHARRERRTALFTTLASRLLPCPAPSGTAGTLSPFQAIYALPSNPPNGVLGLHWKDWLRPTIPATPHWLILALTQLYTELLDTHPQREGQAKRCHEPRDTWECKRWALAP